MASTAPATNILNGYPIRNFDTNDPGATAWANDIKGGHHNVGTIAERDAITAERRAEGMTCWVEETGLLYVLSGGVTNADWVNILEFTASAADLEATNALLEEQITKAAKDRTLWLFQNAKTAANWAGWEPLMPNPPTLSTSSSSQIASSVLFNAVTNPEYFTFLSAKFIEGGSEGTGGNPGFLYSRGVSGSFLSLPNAVEFYTDAPEFEIQSFPTGAANLQFGTRLWVDGKLASINQIPTRAYDGVNQAYDRVVFGTAITRHIRLEFFSVPWKGIRVPPTYRVWTTTTRKKPRVIAIGDSFVQPTGQGAGNVWRGWFGLLANKFDWDLWASGAGGTGYSNPGPATNYKVVDRLQSDVISNSPDFLIFEPGINDSSPTYLATLAADVEAAYDLIDTALPGIPVAVLTPVWPTASPTADLYAARAIIMEAAKRHGYWIIDPTDPQNPWIDSNNKQSYHPTVRAAGTVSLGGGGISSATVTNPGGGYHSIPTITLTGGTGSGGVLGAVVDGRVKSCTMLNKGEGYDGTTTVTLVGGGGSGATASPVISGGEITGITITAPGTGYTQPPRVVISGVRGAGGAVAVSAMEYIVTAIEVLTPGSYTVAPTVNFTYPVGNNSLDSTHPGLWGHGYYAERLAYELWSRSQSGAFSVNPPPPASGEGEALAWKTRAEAAGGLVSDSTLSNVEGLVVSLKQAGVWTKIDWLWAAAGDYAAALVPIKVGHGAATLTPTVITGSDYAETGATAGFKGDGSTKYLDTGYNTSTAGLSLTDAHVMNYVKGVEAAGTSRWSMGNATAATPSNCTGFGWLTGGTIDVGCIASYGTGGGPSPSPGTGAKEGVLIISANGSRSGDYYDDGTLVPSSVNMGANSYANCNIFLLARNVNGTADANKSTRYMRAAAIGQGLTSTQAAAYSTALTAFANRMGWT